MSFRTISLFFLSGLLLFASSALAGAFPYGSGATVIGTPRSYVIERDDSLIELARKFDLGYNEMVEANPGVDPFIPDEGATVLVPASWIIPDVPSSHRGIVINLTEMRLYYFLNKGGADLVVTFPIGIGSQGTDTPVGSFRITKKVVNPTWYVPKSIQREMKAEGEPVKTVVPPGPDNPLGSHELRLNLGSILIHGTNRPLGIGRKASHGCIRLYPEDIPKLFQLVRVGTPVLIVRQPIKVGFREDRVFIEVHHDDSRKNFDYFEEAVQLLRKKDLLRRISTEKLHQALLEKKGIPVEISGNGEVKAQIEFTP